MGCMRDRVKMMGVVAVASLLSGCMESSVIQLKYNHKRDECRRIAELRAETMGARPLELQRIPINKDMMPQDAPVPYSQIADSVPVPLSPREKTDQLARAYNDCMGEQGWNIAPPPKDKDKDKDK